MTLPTIYALALDPTDPSRRRCIELAVSKAGDDWRSKTISEPTGVVYASQAEAERETERKTREAYEAWEAA